jgi:hypothetical protein
MNLDEITIINITENNLIHHINTFVFNLLRGHESLALNYIYIYIWGVGVRGGSLAGNELTRNSHNKYHRKQFVLPDLYFNI